MKKNLLPLALTAAVFAALHSSASAQILWNAGSGDWDNAANWTPNTVPNAVDADARINNLSVAGPYTISASSAQNFTVGRLDLSTNSGATTNDIDLTLGSNAGLILDVSTGVAQLNFVTNNNTGSTITVNSGVQLNDNLTVTVTRNTAFTAAPTLAGNVNLQGNTLNIGNNNNGLRFNGLVSGAGSINAGFVDHGSIRDITFTNTASNFSGGVMVGRHNRIALGLSGSNVNFTGTGGGGIIGTGTISVAANSTINDDRASTLQSNGAFNSSDADTTTNVLANNIDVAAGRFLRVDTGRPINFTGTLSGTGTLVKQGGSSSGTRLFAINTASPTYAGTVEIQDGQVIHRVDNALGSSSTIRFNPTSTGNGAGLFGSAVSGTNAAIASILDFRRTATGNSQFITTAGNSTFTLSGNFSNTGTGTAGYIGVGRGNGNLSNVGGGFSLGSNTGTATIRLTGAGSLENNIGIVDGTTTASVLSLGNTSGTQTFTGIVSGNGDLVRDGVGGTTVLGGNNSYTGTTTVTAGTLILNGTYDVAATGAVNVATAGIIGGSGTLQGLTTVSGSVRPGNSIGTLNVTKNTTWNGGVDWVFELGTASIDLATANANNTNQDLLNITGNFLKGTGSTFTFDFAGTGANGFYKIVDYTGTTGFVNTDFLATNLAGGQTGTFTVDAGTTALYLTVVPEPSTYVMLIGGVGALLFFRRRKA